nr:MAG TPA: hypothetical protein [Caudoviricetes sp.]
MNRSLQSVVSSKGYHGQSFLTLFSTIRDN